MGRAYAVKLRLVVLEVNGCLRTHYFDIKDMAQTKITWERLLQVMRRQWQDRWSPHYVSGIFADPKEAPGISTAAILRPKKLGGRELHTLSKPETWSALLALYNPACFEIFDQRVLSIMPRPHLLVGHAKAVGLALPSFRGSLDVCERLGRLSKHPKVRDKRGSDPASWPWVPFPYFGDLTLCLEDKDGPYVVDWPIKDKYENFRRRGPKRGTSRPDADDPGTVARQRIQELYFLDAGIRTQQIVGDSIDKEVRRNLRMLFMETSWPATLMEASARNDLVHELNQTVGKDVPAFLTARRLSTPFKVQPATVLSVLYRAIWNREIRVDLFRPVLSDSPLYPERKDVLVHYFSWFSR